MGFLVANDLLSDASYSLLQTPVFTTLGTNVTIPGNLLVAPGSMVGIYPGAQLLIGGDKPELVQVQLVTTNDFQAYFRNTHLSTDSVSGATFPLGFGSKQLFTQSEMLGYLADVQKDYLLKTRIIFSQVIQTINAPGKYAPAPATAIRVERIAINGCQEAIVAVSRGNGVTTVFFQSAIPACFMVGSPVTIKGMPNGVNGTAFNGTFTITYLGGIPYGFGAYGAGPYGALYAITFNQTSLPDDHLVVDATVSAPIAVAGSGGALFNSSQTSLDLMIPKWPTRKIPTVPTTWFQDQANLATLGFYPPYQAGGPAEIWYSDRGPDSVALNSSLTVPDAFCHYLKYGVLERAFSKDGEMRDEQRAMYCKKRFDLGVVIGVRFMMGVQASLMKEQQDAQRYSPMAVQQQPVGVGA